jgi:hypothetical protein
MLCTWSDTIRYFGDSRGGVVQRLDEEAFTLCPLFILPSEKSAQEHPQQSDEQRNQGYGQIHNLA